MIFISVGSHNQGFERLIKKMDEIAGRLDEEIIIQIGYTDYKPKNSKYFDFIEDFQEIIKLNKKAKLIVCHGGAGTIFTALEHNTPVIAVPRLKKYHEHINDHQLELVNILAENKKIKAVYDIEKLESVINSSLKDSSKVFKKDDRLIKALREYVNKFIQ